MHCCFARHPQSGYLTLTLTLTLTFTLTLTLATFEYYIFPQMNL